MQDGRKNITKLCHLCVSAAAKAVNEGKFEADINWKHVLSSEIAERGRQNVMQVRSVFIESQKREKKRENK